MGKMEKWQKLLEPQGFEGLDIGRVAEFEAWLDNKTENDAWLELPAPIEKTIRVLSMNLCKELFLVSEMHVCKDCLKDWALFIDAITARAVAIALHQNEVQDAIGSLREVGEI